MHAPLILVVASWYGDMGMAVPGQGYWWMIHVKRLIPQRCGKKSATTVCYLAMILPSPSKGGWAAVKMPEAVSDTSRLNSFVAGFKIIDTKMACGTLRVGCAR